MKEEKKFSMSRVLIQSFKFIATGIRRHENCTVAEKNVYNFLKRV